jgi:hypothetical protein
MGFYGHSTATDSIGLILTKFTKVVSETKYLTTSGIKMSASVQQVNNPIKLWLSYILK